MKSTMHRSIALLFSTLLFVPTTAWAQSKSQRQFERAYFLETHESNPKAAAEAYKKVVADKSASKELAAEARRRGDSCNEDLRSEDLAALMPPGAVAYVELRNPGQHIENLADMLGLLGDPLAQAVAGKTGTPIPDSPGLILPHEVFLSSGILDQLKGFRGLGFAFMGIEGPPAGNPALAGVQALLVIHPGDDEGLRGCIETAAQFVQPTDPISGFATLQIEPGVVVTFTNRLVIAGTSRALVGDAIDRLTSIGHDSLATRPDFQEFSTQRNDALLFATVNVNTALVQATKIASQDQDAMQAIGMAYGMLDAAHMQNVWLCLGSTTEGMYGEFGVSMDEEHNNFVYNMIRMPPMQGVALRNVPAGAAAVVALGINPAAVHQDANHMQQKMDKLRAVTGFDLGRELFSNIKEIALFVNPGERQEGVEIPDAALIIAAADPSKSMAIWDQLLSIPSRIMGMELPEPASTTIDGSAVKSYAMPDGGPTIFVAGISQGLVVSPSEAAIKAVLATGKSGKSILDDPGMSRATSRLGKDTSVAVIIHAGRAAQVGAQFCPPGELGEVQAAASLLSNTMFTLSADEAPNMFRLSGSLTGLPKIKDVISVASQMMAMHGHEHRAETVTASANQAY